MMRGWLDATPEEIAEQWSTRKPMERIVERLEEENKRLKKLKNGFIALSDHEVCDIENQAYQFAIEIVRKGGVKNEINH